MTDEGAITDVGDARALFPGTADKTFLDAACVSLAPLPARHAIDAFLDEAIHCRAVDASQHHIAMDAARNETVDEAARLLHVETKNIALVESTTHGLNIAAAAVPLSPGDNVLVADSEFLQVAVPWAKLTPQAELRRVTTTGGRPLVEDFERAMDRRTRVVAVSSVQWASGHRVDVPRLAELCRERDIWLVVDAIQEIGAMSVDLSGSAPDFVIAGGHKWLNAPFGCGIAYLSDRVIEELDPPGFGYLALEEPQGGWGAYFRTPDITPFRDYEFPATAKRFEIGGTANYPGAIGLAASLKIVNRIGIEAVEAHIRHLGGVLRKRLEELGARLVSTADPATVSGITAFQVLDTPAEDHALLERVLRDRVYLSMRYTSGVGGLRASTHYYNTEDDVHTLADSLERTLRDQTTRR